MGLTRLVALLLLLPAPAIAQFAGEPRESLECMVDAAERIVRGRVVSIDRNARSEVFVRIRVLATLKGPRAHELICGFFDGPDSSLDPEAGEHLFMLAGGKDGPLLHFTAPSIPLLDSWFEFERVPAADLRWLRSRRAVLEAVKARVAGSGPVPPKPILVDTPSGPLYVPLEPAVISRAREWMRGGDVPLRLSAVSVLLASGGQEDVALLRGALDDPAVKDTGAGRFFTRTYPVRTAAADALAKRGLPLPKRLVLTEPDDLYGAVPLGSILLVLIPAGVLAVGVHVWRAAPGRPSVIRAVLRGYTSLALVLTALVLGLWVRSFWRVDQVVFPLAADGRAEFLSARGALSYARVNGHRADVRRYLSLPVDHPFNLHWSWQQNGPTDQWRRLGCTFAEGPDALTRYYCGQSFAWRMVAIPHWFVCVAAWLPLVLVPIYSSVRQRRSYRRQICAHCGYDLRASAGVCPECGTPIVTPGPGVLERMAIQAAEIHKAEQAYCAAMDDYHDRLAAALGGLAARAEDPAAALDRATADAPAVYSPDALQDPATQPAGQAAP